MGAHVVGKVLPTFFFPWRARPRWIDDHNIRQYGNGRGRGLMLYVGVCVSMFFQFLIHNSSYLSTTNKTVTNHIIMDNNVHLLDVMTI